MKFSIYLTLICILSAPFINPSVAQFTKDSNDSVQEAAAIRIMDSLETGNTIFLFNNTDSSYLKSQRQELEKKARLFISNFSGIKNRTNRYNTRILPEGINTFRFQYTGDSGVLLQADLSFKKNNPSTSITKLAITPTLSFREQWKRFNPEKKPAVKSFFNMPPDHPLFIDLRNCSGEKRTVTYSNGIDFIYNWVLGQTSLAVNKTVLFSKVNKPDSNFLKSGIYELRKALPANYWSFPFGTEWYDYLPNEKGIWFIRILAYEDKAGHITFHAAYKITFEGTDARIDAQRANPRIKSVEFITAKENLAVLEKILKTSAKKLI